MSGDGRRRFAAEAVGTALLVGLGTGAIVAAARRGGAPLAEIAIAWFVAVAIPIMLFARVSGAHLNPAVTLGLVVARRFPARAAFPYVTAQLLGAFAGSAAVRVALGPDAHLGATVPNGGDVLLVFPLEMACTAALLAAVLVSVERPASRLALLGPATVVGVATFLIGPWTGCSLNPARSIAPAVLSGEYLGLWAYLLAVPAAAAIVGLLGRQRLDPSAAGSGAVPAPGPSGDRGAN